MRSRLILNRPWQGTGNRSEWSFTGADDLILRESLDRLDAYVAPDASDRWTAALVFGFLDGKRHRITTAERISDARAWTLDGALALAEMLPDELDDLRGDLEQSFRARKDGRQGDATTPPRG